MKRFAQFLVPVALLFAAPASAQHAPPAAVDLGISAEVAQDIEIGNGLICETPEQAARYVAVYDDDADQALKKVNAETKRTSCTFAQIAFIRGKEIARAHNKEASVAIVEIAVIGIVTQRGVEQRAPTSRFAIFPVEELRV